MNAAQLLTTLATCNPADGQAAISEWLDTRPAAEAASDLLVAAASGTPGERGAAFAVLDRMGSVADEVRSALAVPELRPHAAMWLSEKGEDGPELSTVERYWLLADLGAGLLEAADPADVVGDLLPDVDYRARVVAELSQTDHPAVHNLLTVLGEYHPDPAVSAAAREALGWDDYPEPRPD